MIGSQVRWFRVVAVSAAGGVVAVVCALLLIAVWGRPAHAQVVCTISGTAGNDMLVGTAGDDVICGLGGNDYIRGAGGNDTLVGDAGDDILVPDAGNDTVDGGPGVDHVNYVVVTVGGVNIDLVAGTANSAAGNDTLVSIERATGTNFVDTITGNGGDNVLAGLFGADTITGAGGNDTIYPGHGDDPIINGGPGIDTVNFSGTPAAVTIDMPAGTATGGYGTDTLISIESAKGSSFDDFLIGLATGSTLEGGAGDDHLKGSTGIDRLDGGTNSAGGFDVCLGKGGTDVITNCEDTTNAAPTATPQGVSTVEDSATGTPVTLTGTDPENDPLTFSYTQPAAGTVTGTAPNVTYTPSANVCGPDSFTFTATDWDGATDDATISVTVTCVNDAPTITLSGSTPVFTEDGPAATVDAALTVSDIDDTSLVSGTVSITAGAVTGDTLSFTPAGGITDTNPAPGVLALTGTTTVANWQSVLRSVQFASTSGNPTAASRTVSFTVNDGDAPSNTAQKAVSVVPVNDAPVLTQPDAAALGYTEGAAATVIAPNLTATDVDSTDLVAATITIGTGYANGQDVLSLGANPQNGITAGAFDAATGTLTLTGTSTVANYQTALRDVRYANTSQDPTTAARPISFQVDDGPGPNDLSNIVTRNVNVTPVNDPPVAGDDSFTGAIGNTVLVVNDPDDPAPTVVGANNTISGDILAGDTDIDGPGPLVVQAGTFPSNDGGSVTIEADGDFTYTPAAGTSCTDTSDLFTYTVTDQNTPTAGTDTGQVTISITGCVWYVSNNAAGNTGTSNAPFDTLAQADTAIPAGDVIFVFDGNNTTAGYTTGVDLAANQRLIGEAANLVVNGVTLHTAVPANRPTITDTSADVVNLASGNTITGVDIDPQGGGGIAGGTGDNSGTISDVNVVDSSPFGTQPGIELDATSGTWNLLSNLTVSTNGAIGVRLNNAGTVNFMSAATISITTAGARALDAAGASTSFGTASVIDAITVTGSPTGAVGLTATTGTLALGDGSGTDLALTTTSGPTAAFFSTHTGTLSVDGAGTDNISATGGPAVDITGPGTFDFDDVDSTNSSTDGINLDAFGTGTFTALSGDITGAAGIAFDVNGGSGTVTYPGNLNNGTGSSADITGRSGGTVTLSGLINDNNDTGGGITVTNNTGGTTTFTNATKTLNTTTGNAVTLSSNTGHTITFIGGGLDIDTTGGNGFAATGGGTITVQGTNNTITTTTGTALNIANTTIGTADVTFQSISANGAPNGIVVNTTGTAGNLVVTGDGDGNPDGGGGAIQNTTSHGISLSSTLSPSLTDVSVVNAGNADNEYGLLLSNVGGTVTLDDMSFNNAADNLVYLTSTTSSTVNVTGSAFTYPGTISPTANSAILLEPGGAANLTASITGSTFTNILNASTQIGANTLNASGTLSLTFSNNTINSVTGRAGGVVVSGQELTTTSLTITSNTFTGAGGNGVISIDTNDTSAVTGTISNNTISNPPGIGIFSAVDEAATSTLTFNGNTITNSGGDGIQLVNFGGVGSSTMNATVTNNTVNGHSLNTAVSFVGGISVTGFEEVIDLQLTGNIVLGTPASPTQCGGAPCVDYYIEEVGGTFRLEEIPNTAATTANAAYVNSTNDAGPVTIFGIIDLSNGVEISSS